MATTPAPPATTWGNPTAPKRALLLHGLTSCSHAWVRVAEGLVENDYYIVAPDLLGHGNARRPSPSTNGGEYTVVALAADLQPHIHPSECTPPISLIIGHSLGALIALELIPSLLPNPRPLRMILVDPPLEVHHSLLPGIRASCIAEIAHVPSIEAYGMKNPLWTRKDVVARVTGTMLCDPDAVSAIIEQNTPWSFTHLLPTTSSPSFNMTIIAGDPALNAAVSTDEITALGQTHPHIRVLTVKGASHNVQREFPDVVVEAALRGE